MITQRVLCWEQMRRGARRSGNVRSKGGGLAGRETRTGKCTERFKTHSVRETTGLDLDKKNEKGYIINIYFF